ncbi:MAG: hypothetical protein QGH94_08150 [Phycisphaerae bacterium]|nr:hypothetical protein [Phycisphaerae bacterium]
MRLNRIFVGIATSLLGVCSAFGAGSRKHLQIIRNPDTGKLVAIRMPVIDGKPQRVDEAKVSAGDLRIYELGRGRPIPLKNASKPANGPTSRPAKLGRTGFYRTKFSQRSPHSSLKGMLAKLGWKKDPKFDDYSLENFTFEVYVPRNYDGTKPYGIMVYISPSPYVYHINVRGYRAIYDKHSLIHVAAYNSGNKQYVPTRLGLAMDAVHNIKRMYNIAKDRIYVTGTSGGGRCSAMLGLGFADVFDGAIPQVGCYFFTRIMSLENPKKGWSGRFNRPTGAIFRKAKLTNRFVLLTGERDFNRNETESIHVNGFKKLNFKHATYLEVKGMGHTIAPAKYMEKGIVTLDAPLKARPGRTPGVIPALAASKAIRLAQRLIKTSKHESAYAELADLAVRYPTTASAAKAKRMIAELKRTHPRIAASHVYDQQQSRVDAAMTTAKKQISAKQFSKAKQTLGDLIVTWPDHTEAKDALSILESIWGKTDQP